MLIVKAWYLDYPLLPEDVEQRPPTLRLSKKSLLKAAFRGFFVDDAQAVQQAAWFRAFLAGEKVEFYLEGSGTYTLANMDLVSREVYLERSEMPPAFPPLIFFCDQTDYPDSSTQISQALHQVVGKLQTQHRLKPKIRIERPARLPDGTVRLDTDVRRLIRQSLVVIADTTLITCVNGKGFPSPEVCLEVGYALVSKKPYQIKLVQWPSPEPAAQDALFPFSISDELRLMPRNAAELARQLEQELTDVFKRFRLL
ncbi:MAG: hypothetical protein RMI89_04375 [Gloeomargarita sp. SKYBB_i_bin120]|nr:hypothetical protein [Gloeomargarita sp. SKYB120]MDW8177756.1 hypothetical protein [Gloeomargarita sp. SKYBB_i_bin120]